MPNIDDLFTGKIQNVSGSTDIFNKKKKPVRDRFRRKVETPPASGLIQFFKGAAGGIERTIGGVGDIAAMMYGGEQPGGGEHPIAEWGKSFSEKMNELANTGWEAPQPEVLEGWDYPVKKSLFYVGSGVPQGLMLMVPGQAAGLAAKAAGASQKMINIAQMIGGGVPIGALVGSSTYKSGREAGLTHEQALPWAFASGVGEGILEVALPLSSWIKPGRSIWRRTGRVAVEESIEEVLQGIWTNTLEVMGWEGTEDLYKKMTNGLIEGAIAGFGAGGILGLGSPVKTAENIAGDLYRKRKKAGVINKKTGKPYTYAENLEAVNAHVDKLGEVHKKVADWLRKSKEGIKEEQEPVVEARESLGGYETHRVKITDRGDITTQPEVISREKLTRTPDQENILRDQGKTILQNLSIKIGKKKTLSFDDLPGILQEEIMRDISTSDPDNQFEDQVRQKIFALDAYTVGGAIDEEEAGSPRTWMFWGPALRNGLDPRVRLEDLAGAVLASGLSPDRIRFVGQNSQEAAKTFGRVYKDKQRLLIEDGDTNAIVDEVNRAVENERTNIEGEQVEINEDLTDAHTKEILEEVEKDRQEEQIKDQPTGVEAPITEPMSFDMPADGNIWGKDISTFEAIKQGLRTSTTRGYWRNQNPDGSPSFNIGDYVNFQNKDKTETVKVQITGIRKITADMKKNPHFLKEWSDAEGHTIDHAKKNNYIKGYQVTFKLADPVKQALANVVEAMGELAGDTEEEREANKFIDDALAGKKSNDVKNMPKNEQEKVDQIKAELSKLPEPLRRLVTFVKTYTPGNAVQEAQRFFAQKGGKLGQLGLDPKEFPLARSFVEKEHVDLNKINSIADFNQEVVIRTSMLETTVSEAVQDRNDPELQTILDDWKKAIDSGRNGAATDTHSALFDYFLLDGITKEVRKQSVAQPVFVEYNETAYKQTWEYYQNNVQAGKLAKTYVKRLRDLYANGKDKSDIEKLLGKGFSLEIIPHLPSAEENDPQVAKFKALACSSWCVRTLTTALGYVRETENHILFKDGEPILGIALYPDERQMQDGFGPDAIKWKTRIHSLNSKINQYMGPSTIDYYDESIKYLKSIGVKDEAIENNSQLKKAKGYKDQGFTDDNYRTASTRQERVANAANSLDYARRTATRSVDASADMLREVFGMSDDAIEALKEKVAVMKLMEDFTPTEFSQIFADLDVAIPPEYTTRTPENYQNPPGEHTLYFNRIGVEDAVTEPDGVWVPNNDSYITYKESQRLRYPLKQYQEEWAKWAPMLRGEAIMETRTEDQLNAFYARKQALEQEALDAIRLYIDSSTKPTRAEAITDAIKHFEDEQQRLYYLVENIGAVISRYFKKDAARYFHFHAEVLGETNVEETWNAYKTDQIRRIAESFQDEEIYGNPKYRKRTGYETEEEAGLAAQGRAPLERHVFSGAKVQQEIIKRFPEVKEGLTGFKRGDREWWPMLWQAWWQKPGVLKKYPRMANRIRRQEWRDHNRRWEGIKSGDIKVNWRRSWSKNKDKVQAYYDSGTDKVVLVLDNIQPQDVNKLVIHEAVHRGIVKFANDIGGKDELHKILLSAKDELIKAVPELIQRTGHADFEEFLADYGFDPNTPDGEIQLLGELAARWGERFSNRPQETWWKNLITAIQEWFAKFVGIQMSEKDVDNLVSGFLHVGTSEGTPVKDTRAPPKPTPTTTTINDKGETAVHAGKGLNVILSNFSESPFKYRGVTFLTAEGAYQAHKSGRYVEGFEALTGAQAKSKGRMYKVDKDTNLDLMRDILTNKLMQVPAFADALLNSGKITHPVTDKFWAKNFPMLLEELKQQLQDIQPTPTGKKVMKSGAASGSDDLFGQLANENGWDVQNYSFAGHRRANEIGIVELTPEQLEEGTEALKLANKKLFRKVPGASTTVGKLLRRNWYQIKDTNVVVAVGYIQANGTVKGGTGWAVQMAVDNRAKLTELKDIFVFDQGKKAWFFHDGKTWKEIGVDGVINAMRANQKITGIGSRAITEDGKNAVRELFTREPLQLKPDNLKTFFQKRMGKRFGRTFNKGIPVTDTEMQGAPVGTPVEVTPEGDVNLTAFFQNLTQGTEEETARLTGTSTPPSPETGAYTPQLPRTPGVFGTPGGEGTYQFQGGQAMEERFNEARMKAGLASTRYVETYGSDGEKADKIRRTYIPNHEYWEPPVTWDVYFKDPQTGAEIGPVTLTTLTWSSGPNFYNKVIDVGGPELQSLLWKNWDFETMGILRKELGGQIYPHVDFDGQKMITLEDGTQGRVMVRDQMVVQADPVFNKYIGKKYKFLWKNEKTVEVRRLQTERDRAIKLAQEQADKQRALERQQAEADLLKPRRTLNVGQVRKSYKDMLQGRGQGLRFPEITEVGASTTATPTADDVTPEGEVNLLEFFRAVGREEQRQKDKPWVLERYDAPVASIENRGAYHAWPTEINNEDIPAAVWENIGPTTDVSNRKDAEFETEQDSVQLSAQAEAELEGQMTREEIAEKEAIDAWSQALDPNMPIESPLVNASETAKEILGIESRLEKGGLGQNEQIALETRLSMLKGMLGTKGWTETFVVTAETLDKMGAERAGLELQIKENRFVPGQLKFLQQRLNYLNKAIPEVQEFFENLHTDNEIYELTPLTKRDKTGGVSPLVAGGSAAGTPRGKAKKAAFRTPGELEALGDEGSAAQFSELTIKRPYLSIPAGTEIFVRDAVTGETVRLPARGDSAHGELDINAGEYNVSYIGSGIVMIQGSAAEAYVMPEQLNVIQRNGGLFNSLPRQYSLAMPFDGQKHEAGEAPNKHAQEYATTLGKILKGIQDIVPIPFLESLERFMGPRILKKQRVELETTDEVEDFIKYIGEDKNYDTFAKAKEFEAKNTLWKGFRDLVIEEFKKEGIKPTKAMVVQRLKTYGRIAFFAMEEFIPVYEKKHKKMARVASSYRVKMTDIGFHGKWQSGLHATQNERDYTLRKVKDIYKELGKEIDPNEWKNWVANGLPELFWLKLLPTKAKQWTIWAKGYIEDPILFAQMKAGAFNRADMIRNRRRGYVKRAFDFIDEDTRKNYYKSLIATKEVFYKKYRTAPEYLVGVGVDGDEGAGLVPYDTIFDAVGKYAGEGLMRAHQHVTIGKMKLIHNPGVPFNLGIVAYEKDLPKTVQHKKRWFEEHGYVQLKNAPGLTEHWRGAFQVPWVRKDMAQLLEDFYAYKDEHPWVKSWLKINGRVKRFVMFSPYQFALQIVSSPMLWYSNPGTVWKLAIKPVITGEILWKAPSQLLGKKMRGEEFYEDPFQHMNNPDYDPELLDLFLQNGLNSFVPGQVFQQFYDSEMAKIHPDERSQMEDLGELLGTRFGIDNYVFNNYVARNMYEFAKTFYVRLQKDGFAKPDAAREAVRLANNMSGMLSNHSFGKEGPIAQALFFARNFTWSFFRQLTGATYPIWKQFHTYKTGKLAAMNSLLHADTTSADMDTLWKYYLSHLFRIMMMKMTVITLAQWALMSAWGRDHPDEVSEEDKWTFNNWKDPGKFGMIKTPFKDPGNATVYIDPLLWREMSQFINLFPGLGRGPGAFIKGKLNWGFRTVVEQISNADYAGRPITDNTGSIPWDTVIAERAKHIAVSALPAFTREAPKVSPFWNVTQAVGFPLKRGVPVEPGQDISEAVAFKKYLNVEMWKDSQIRDLIYTAKPHELQSLRTRGIITSEQYRNALFRRKAPVFFLKKKNKTDFIKWIREKKERRIMLEDYFRNTD